ncbi:MAG: sugar phosphate isomerase/epimerase [Saprospiraceae bacterium]|nr:sugar phosphate isomerase/epimerase [Saprospiraceae bacterium]
MKHNSRREFLKTTSLAMAGAAVSSPASAMILDAYPAAHLGVQLWSVRDAMAKDAAGTIAALGKMGYREVEGFGYKDGNMFGLPIKDYAKLLRDNGISSPSCHQPVTLADWNASGNSISDSLKKAIDDMASIGQRYVVAPWMGEQDRPRIAELVKVFNATGEYCRKAGVRFGYHNHNFEYEQRGPDNRLLIEWLLHETDPKLVAMEMDMYWVAYAKHNPIDWFRIYPGRWELCHVKDMAKTEKRETVEVGDGSINFTEIFKHSAKAGLKYYIIELEHYVTTSMEGVKKARAGFMRI